MHIIISKRSIVKINIFGAELKSYNINGNEIIWQSNPDIWKKSAPILFPFVGRLKDQKYIYNGKEYEISKHGFASTQTFAVESQHRDKISLILKSNSDLTKIYPFKFLLRVTYSIEKNILHVNYEVENHDENTMYFSIGSHPAISLPLNNTKLEDYYIEFEENETLHPLKLVDDLLEKQKKPYLDNEKIIKIDEHTFDNDALIFSDVKSRNIFIKNDVINRNIKINMQQAPDLGIWSKSGADYVCIEPWHGHDDTTDVSGILEEKPGIISIQPGDTFKTGYSIEALSL